MKCPKCEEEMAGYHQGIDDIQFECPYCGFEIWKKEKDFRK